MAAITTQPSPFGNFYSETTTSSATLVRYLLVPAWAQYALVMFTPTTIGTSATLAFTAVDPVALDDSYVVRLAEHGNLTAITAANTTLAVQIGPGVTGIADDVTNSASADSYVSLNAVLPAILGVSVANSGSNTYYLSVLFRGR